MVAPTVFIKHRNIIQVCRGRHRLSVYKNPQKNSADIFYSFHLGFDSISAIIMPWTRLSLLNLGDASSVISDV